MSRTQPAEPAPERAAFERVQLLIEARRPHDAMRAAEAGLSADPEDPNLIAAMAWAHLTAGDHHAARTWSERSLALDPSSAWVHDLRARALLQGAGKPQEAQLAARSAVRGDPYEPLFLYTLVRASLEGEDRAGAEEAAATLRRTAPASHLGPLADALIELERGGVYRRREYSLLALVALAVVTSGLGLVVAAIMWIVHALRRAPHVRRADALLNEALRLRPGDASVRTVASEALGLRFRFAQAVDYEVAAAAIDAGLVDANQLATSVARRTTVVIVAGWTSWIFIVAFAQELVSSHLALALGGLVFAAGVTLSIHRFDRWQTRSLPRMLVANVHRRWPPPVTAAFAAAFLIIAGSYYLGEHPDRPAEGYHLASLVSAPVAAACACIFGARFARARRKG